MQLLDFRLGEKALLLVVAVVVLARESLYVQNSEEPSPLLAAIE